jgi:hypothetical protein
VVLASYIGLCQKSFTQTVFGSEPQSDSPFISINGLLDSEIAVEPDKSGFDEFYVLSECPIRGFLDCLTARA